MFTCECARGRRYLKVGKAVALRVRLQSYLRYWNDEHESAFLKPFVNDPHNHKIFVSIWKIPRNEIVIAETTLIDHLSPTENRQDLNCGNPSLWAPRLPDLDGLTLADFWPRSYHKRDKDGKLICELTIKNEPGVYAWWIDPRLDGPKDEFDDRLIRHLSRWDKPA